MEYSYLQTIITNIEMMVDVNKRLNDMIGISIRLMMFYINLVKILEN